MKLHGIYPPITTPFDHNGDIWKVKVQQTSRNGTALGLSGYVVCGSTGESVMLTLEEKLHLWEWVAEYCRAGEVTDRGHGSGERSRDGRPDQPRGRARATKPRWCARRTTIKI